MLNKKGDVYVFGVKITSSSAIVGFHIWLCSFFDEWLFYSFWVYYLPKQLNPCHRKVFLFALYSSHYMTVIENWIRWDVNDIQISMRFKVDENLIYKSKTYNSIRWFFVMWIENVNVVVNKNLIHFNSMWYNFSV